MKKLSQAAQRKISVQDKISRLPEGAAETECIETARQLQTVLEEEAEKLKNFAGSELIEVISRKEFLVGELSQRLGSLDKEPGTRPSISAHLKAVLERIDRLNRSNRHFIENSLSHWRDMLSILCPAGYGPKAERTTSPARTPKGLAFSREI